MLFIIKYTDSINNLILDFFRPWLRYSLDAVSVVRGAALMSLTE